MTGLTIDAAILILDESDDSEDDRDKEGRFFVMCRGDIELLDDEEFDEFDEDVEVVVEIEFLEEKEEEL